MIVLANLVTRAARLATLVMKMDALAVSLLKS
jgi:hypothetical protein